MSRDDTTSGLSRRTLLRQGAIATGAATIGVGALSGSAAATYCPRTPGFWANHDWCEVVANSGNGNSVWESIGNTCPASEGEYYTIAGRSETMSGWQAFLTAPTRGDKSVIMGQTVLATALNFYRLPGLPERCENAEECDEPGSCVYEKLDLSSYGIEEEMSIAEVKNEAVRWLDEAGWTNTDGANGNGNGDEASNGNGKGKGKGKGKGNGNGDEASNGNGNGDEASNGNGNGDEASNGNGEKSSWTDGGFDGEPYKDVLDAFNNGNLNAANCFCRESRE
ncbi:MAG: hypothetical protein ABEJ61_01435 [Haloferacaceae archaeon]